MKEKMKFFYNKKFILSLVATLVVVFVVSVLFISYQSGQTELKSTDQLKKIVITRGWGTEQDFAGLNCLKNKKMANIQYCLNDNENNNEQEIKHQILN